MSNTLKQLYDELLADVKYPDNKEDGGKYCNCYSCLMDRASKEVGPRIKSLLAKDPETVRDPLPIELDRTHPLQIYSNTYATGTRSHIVNLLARTAFLMGDKSTQQKTAYCHICGEFHRPTTLNTVKLTDGKFYNVCSKCIQNTLHVCAECESSEFMRGGSHFHRVILSSSKLVYLCPECYAEKYYQCTGCGMASKRGDESDFTKFPNTRFQSYRNPMWICPACKGMIRTCHICKLTIFPRDLHMGKDGNPYCNDCYSLANRNIQEFNFKAHRLPRLLGIKEKHRKDILLFGTEIEVEPRHPEEDLYRDRMAIKVLKYFGRDKCMIKHDGTVREGIEFVSFPFSWRWLHENKKLWTGLFNLFAKNNYYAKSGRAGFHVHMSKAAFTSFHLYKFMEFIYREFNRRFIHIISEREHNWTFAAFLDQDAGRNLIANAKYKSNMSEERHSAISLMYEPTVELRIFGGVDSYDEFMKNLEFCHALFKFSRDVPLKEVRISTVSQYISEHKDKYPYLLKFLVNSLGIKKYYPKTHKAL